MRRPTWTIAWNEGMSVGIPEIDEDHKHFIFLINEFNRSITEQRDSQEIKNKLQLITQSTARHFTHEEILFNNWQYPDIEVHAGIHAHILKAIQDIMEQFTPYGFDSGWIDAGLRIKVLLLDHILTEDMKYAQFYRNSCKVLDRDEQSGIHSNV